jgi:hypothetical protein
MLIQESKECLIVRESPNYSWGAGGILAPLGLVAVVWALGILGGGQILPPPIRSVVLTGGAGCLVFGAFLMLRAPFSTLEIDREDRRVTLRQGRMLRERKQQWRMEEIADASVAQRTSLEGEAAYRVELLHREGGRLPVTDGWTADRMGAERAVEAIQKALSEDGSVQPSSSDNLRAQCRM